MISWDAQTVFDELVALVDPGDLAPPAFDVSATRVDGVVR